MLDVIRRIDADPGCTSIDQSWSRNVNAGYRVARYAHAGVHGNVLGLATSASRSRARSPGEERRTVDPPRQAAVIQSPVGET